jgi:hypothetical protein
MNRRAAMLAMLMLPVGVRRGRAGVAVGQDSERWTPIFNGRDLTAWETFLGKPHKLVEVPGQPRNDQREYLNAIGVNSDPKSVFSIVQMDGGPVIRISGEIYGALTTRAEYENYHLRFDFKWGEKKWPPREQALRDSGCCYHAVGPHGASYGFWMQSFEFQIQEGDCGDFYSLAGVIVDAEGDPVKPGDPKTDLTYRKGASKVIGHTRRIIKDRANEKPHGQWNTLELYCLGQTSVHVVNGTPNMVLSGLRRKADGRDVPLTKGRIQFQSEGAEVFYRNVSIRAIREIPWK